MGQLFWLSPKLRDFCGFRMAKTPKIVEFLKNRPIFEGKSLKIGTLSGQNPPLKMGMGFEARVAHPCPTQIWVPPSPGRSQPHSPGWARVLLSSFFPQISINFSYFSWNFTYFLPHFGPPGGQVAHPGRPWLRHWPPPPGDPEQLRNCSAGTSDTTFNYTGLHALWYFTNRHGKNCTREGLS